MKKAFKNNPYLVTAFIVMLAAVAILCITLFRLRESEKRYKLQVTNSYRHAFTELVSAVDEMDSALQKCIVAGTSGMKSQTFTEVYGASKAAKQALSELPKTADSFQTTSGFISQVGDYAFTLSKSASNGENPGDEAMENLKNLSETTTILKNNLNDMLTDVNSGGLTLKDMQQTQKRAAAKSDALTKDAFTERIKVAEQEFPDSPILIYDGPFSSHISSLTPRMTEGAQEVSQEDARARAEEFFGFSNLSYDGERGGSLPVYMFSMPSENGVVNIEVSKPGGLVVNMYSSHIPETENISAEDAIKKAEQFVAERITDPLTESYHIVEARAVTVNFAYTQDGVICYPDLVKIKVSLETGDVTGFEAQGYVMHHYQRELPEPAVSEEQAREKVSGELKVLSHALTVIPTGGKNEVFCHEFKCEKSDGQHYIVYVNAETGREEQILILVESENGTLAI